MICLYRSSTSLGLLPQLALALVLVGAMVLVGPRAAFGQSTLYSEDFERLSEGDTTPGDGSWTINTTAAAVEDSDDYFAVQERSGDKVFEGRDLDGEAVWKTETVDISSYPDVDFSIELTQAGDHESSDFVDVAYSTDGGSTFTTLTDWNQEGGSGHTLTGDWPEQNVSESGISGSSFVLRVTMQNSAGSEDLRLDEVTISGRGATTVQFTATSGTVTEDEGSTQVGIQLSNPPGSQVTADVAFDANGSSATPTDVGDYSTQTITFSSSANDQDTKTVSVSLTADGKEGSETASFVLENPSQNAIVGSSSQFDLTIRDAVSDHSGEVIITEIMPNPDAVPDSDGEYVELYNTTESLKDIDGWAIDGDAISGVEIPARGLVVICRDGVGSRNGGIQNCDDEVSLSLANGGDNVVLSDDTDAEVDRVEYDDQDWPDPTGASMVFTGTSDNNVGSNWETASRRERGFALDQSGDDGSPGRSGAKQVLQPNTEITGSAGWRLLSAPMGQVSPDVLAQSNLVQGVSGHHPGAGANLYQWPGGPPSSVDWTVPSTKTTDLTTGARGFLWYVFGTSKAPETDPPPFTLSLPGAARTSTVDATGLGEGFYLLGNPYAQSYDLSDLDLPGKNFSTTVQVWDPSAGSYVDVTRSSDASDLIAPYQGFFVERSSGSATKTLQFSPAGRRADPVSLKRGDEGPARIAFQLTGYAADSVVTRDEALTLRARPEASMGWDVFDASKLRPLTGRFVTAAFPGTRDEETELRSVASVPSPLPTDSVGIPIQLTTSNAKAVERLQLAWPSWGQVPATWTVRLHDLVADTTINLRRRDTYSFELEAPEKYRTGSTPSGIDVDEAITPLPLPATIKANAEAGASRFVLTLTRSSIPVELTSLDASVSNERVTLHWATSSETNNAGFYVEHRRGETGPYMDLDFVDGVGTTAQPQRYRYRTDPLQAGRHSFRLRQLDTDGSATRSGPIRVDISLDQAAEMHLNPTPVHSRATLQLRVQSSQHVTIQLFDTMGRMVRTVTEGDAAAGRMHRYQIDAEALASGLYFVRATGEDFRETRRMVVAR